MLKLTAIGHLGKDCTINTVNGKNVINFTVAHTEKWKDAQGNNNEKTVWLECAWWLDSTNIANYLKKGQQVYIEGQPSAKSFQRKNGEVGASLSVQVRQLQLLGSASKPNQDTQSGQGNKNQNEDNLPDPRSITEPIDDLPF